MKKLILILITLIYHLSYSQDNQQHNVNDKVYINNSSASYPGIVINAHDAVNSTPTSHPIIHFQATGGTGTAKLPIPGNRALGTLIFAGHDGATDYQAARIQVNTLSDFTTSSREARMDFNIGNAYNTRMSISGINGNVGIGTTNPTAKLHLQNGLFKQIVPNAVNDWLYLLQSNGANSGFWSNNGKPVLYLRSNPSTLNVAITPDGNSYFNGGNVGIGTTDFNQDPNALFLVNGKILCEEVEVISDVVPDYVFQKYYTGTSSIKADYVMPTLEEVEAFTKENHHLPEVPSAAEIKKDGMQLKEMSTLLLQKVEELTLYTIEQEKRIKALESQLAKKQ